MENIMVTIFEMSLKSALIIAIILVIKEIFKDIFTPKVHYFIWILLIITLSMPYLPSSKYSIYNVHKYIVNKGAEEYKTTVIPKKEYIKNSNIKNSYKPYIQLEDIKPTNALNKLEISFIIWLAGVVIVVFSRLYSGFRFKRAIKREKTRTDEALEELIEKNKLTLKISKKINYKITDLVHVPCIMGLINPTILIPSTLLDKLDLKKLEYVVLHELCHYKRKDIFTNYVIIILEAIHWFNPLVWLGFRIMKNDMEINCDDLVLKHLDKSQRISYASLLIETIEYVSNKTNLNILTNFIGEKNEIKRRIIMIKRFKQNKTMLSLLGLIIVIAIGFFSMPSALSDDKKIDISKTEFKFKGDKRYIYYDIKDAHNANIIDIMFTIRNNILEGVITDIDNNKTILKGSITGHTISLYKSEEGKAIDVFKGTMKDINSISGDYYYLKDGKNETKHIDMKLALIKQYDGIYKIGNTKEIEAIAENIKKIVVQDNKKALEAMIAFPIKVSIDGNKPEVIKDIRGFEEKYSSIINDRVKRIVSMKSTSFMYSDGKRVLLGEAHEGAIWFAKVGKGFKIVAIDN